jgi:hypothetical protein
VDEKEFLEKYWFKNTEVITVTNPRDTDYVFQMMVETGLNPATGKMGQEQRTYIVPAGGSERFPGPIANLYLDQMAKLLAQDDDRIQFMVDFALKAQYYDDLIANKDDLIAQHVPQSTPNYLKAAEQAPVAQEQPFAGAVPAESTPEPKRMGRPPKVKTED